mgnify:CR=1 FL=1
MRKWQLQVSALVLTGAMVVGTPMSVLADMEPEVISEELQKENEVETDVSKKEGAQNAISESELDDEKKDVSEDAEEEIKKEAETEVKDEKESGKDMDAENMDENLPDEVKPENPSEEKPEIENTVEKEPSEEKIFEKLPEEDKMDHVWAFIEKISALPEASEENFDKIKEKYEFIQELADAISELSEEEQAKITNLKKLETLVEWMNSHLETAALSGTCGKNATWTLDAQGVLTIRGTGGIGENTFCYWDQPWETQKDKIQKIVISEGIQWIGYYAFSDLTAVKSIKLPKTLTVIYEGGFGGCETLTEAVIPGNVKKIGYMAFANCNNLQRLILDEGIQEIEANAFQSCNIKQVKIPKSVISIGDCLFANCYKLSHVMIEDGVKQLGASMFMSTALQSVTIPGSVEKVSYGLFCGLENLKNVVLKDGVKCIDEAAFWDCPKLTLVEIPASVTEIKDINLFPGSPLASIAGINGSYAETYAKEHNIPFIAKGEAEARKTTITKIVNTVSGIHVYWDKLPEVKLYAVYRASSKNGDYKSLGQFGRTNYTDTEVESGKTYFYKIEPYMSNTDINYEASDAKGITYVSTPDLTLRVNRSTGVGLGWNKIAGASGYAVYRKSYNGNDAWVRVATITNPSILTWTDTAVKSKNGSVYRYTIRALAGKDCKTLSGCRNTGRTMVRLTTPALNSASAAGATSLMVSWGKNLQADGYEVRLMVDEKVYKQHVVRGSENLTKKFLGLKRGTTYKVQVRAYKSVAGVGSFYSAWSGAKNVTLK